MFATHEPGYPSFASDASSRLKYEQVFPEICSTPRPTYNLVPDVAEHISGEQLERILFARGEMSLGYLREIQHRHASIVLPMAWTPRSRCRALGREKRKDLRTSFP